MTHIHFAGLNTANLADDLEGHDVLISFADVMRRPGVWEREMLPRLRAGKYRRVILDSGAFTVISTPGFHVSVEAYGDFAVEHADLFDVVVNLDDIAGDLKTTQRNQRHLEALGLTVMPVFHQGEPWSVLARYCERYDEIGVGFARKPGGKLVGGCREFLDAFFRRVPKGVQVHGFGMTKWAVSHGYPFHSVDSTTYIAEYRALVHAELGSDPKRREGTSNGLRKRLQKIGRDRVMKLVLRSYHQPKRRAFAASRYVERNSAGQARTVLRRYAPSALAAALSL